MSCWLEVSSAESNVSNVLIDVAGVRGPGADGKVSLVAKGKKEVQKIFQGMDPLIVGCSKSKMMD